jgi:hypothetical protein
MAHAAAWLLGPGWFGFSILSMMNRCLAFFGTVPTQFCSKNTGVIENPLVACSRPTLATSLTTSSSAIQCMTGSTHGKELCHVCRANRNAPSRCHKGCFSALQHMFDSILARTTVVPACACAASTFLMQTHPEKPCHACTNMLSPTLAAMMGHAHVR